MMFTLLYWGGLFEREGGEIMRRPGPERTLLPVVRRKLAPADLWSSDGKSYEKGFPSDWPIHLDEHGYLVFTGLFEGPALMSGFLRDIGRRLQLDFMQEPQPYPLTIDDLLPEAGRIDDSTSEVPQRP